MFITNLHVRMTYYNAHEHLRGTKNLKYAYNNNAYFIHKHTRYATHAVDSIYLLWKWDSLITLWHVKTLHVMYLPECD